MFTGVLQNGTTTSWAIKGTMQALVELCAEAGKLLFIISVIIGKSGTVAAMTMGCGLLCAILCKYSFHRHRLHLNIEA